MSWASFASHEWTTPKCHEFVAFLANMLQRDGISVWLDQDQMAPGDILDMKMAQGILHSTVPLIFLTSKYREKASGEGPKGREDNVFKEFEFIRIQKSLDSTIPIVLDNEMLSIRNWGVISFGWGNPLFVPMIRSFDLFRSSKSIDPEEYSNLVSAIQRKMGDSSRSSSGTESISSRFPHLHHQFGPCHLTASSIHNQNTTDYDYSPEQILLGGPKLSPNFAIGSEGRNARRWSSQGGSSSMNGKADEQWLKLEFPHPIHIEQLEINWENSVPFDWSVHGNGEMIQSFSSDSAMRDLTRRVNIHGECSSLEIKMHRHSSVQSNYSIWSINKA